MNVYKLLRKATNLIILLIGIILVILGVYNENELLKTIFISIGTSILSSCIITFINCAYLNQKNEQLNIIEQWGISGIYMTRAEMNNSSNKKLDNAKKNIDIIALGMRAYRDAKEEVIKLKLQNNVQLRILTINPDNELLKEKEKEENVYEGAIKKDIKELINWGKSLKKENNNITIKIYNAYPFDSYLRIDDTVYVGPQWYKTTSQQTMAYEFTKGGKGYICYTKYFEKLWNDDKLSKKIV